MRKVWWHPLLWRARLIAPLLTAVVVAQAQSRHVQYYVCPVTLTDSTLSLPAIPPSGVRGVETVCEARVALDKVSQLSGTNPSYWELLLTGTDGRCVRVSLHIVDPPSGVADMGKQGRGRVLVGDDVIAQEDFYGFSTLPARYNSLSVRLNDAGELRVSGGGSHGRPLLTARLPEAGFAPDSVRLHTAGAAQVGMFAAGSTGIPSVAETTDHTLDGLRERFSQSSDPVEGFWRYFDRQNDPSYARPGGEYTLALVNNGQRGEYDIVLVDGARVYADKWRPMMLKGHLRATVFAGHYDLKWIDASFEPMTSDIHATIEEGALLTLSFPLYKTTLRFSKLPL